MQLVGLEDLLQLAHLHLLSAPQHPRQFLSRGGALVKGDAFAESVDVDFAVAEHSIEEGHLEDVLDGGGSQLVVEPGVGGLWVVERILLMKSLIRVRNCCSPLRFYSSSRSIQFLLFLSKANANAMLFSQLAAQCPLPRRLPLHPSLPLPLA
jgi:hypothetical protein